MPTQTVGAEADCSTFSVADIERIWGPGVQPPAPGGTNKVTELTGPGTLRWSCKYEYSDANGLVVRVDYRVHADEAAAKGSFAGIVSGETSLAKREPDRVDLGDEAIVTAPAPKDVQRQIYVRKGQVIFLLGALNMKTGAGADFTDKLQKTYKLRF